MLALVLVSGAMILMLAALVLRPDESHGPAEAAAVASEHEAEEQAIEGATGETVEHADTPEVATGDTNEHADTSEVANSAESESEEVGHDQPESAHDDRQSNPVLGVDVESLNLALPWLTIVLAGLTVLLAIGLAIWRSTALLVACVGLGLAGIAIGIYEATRAGEELGIFVPLPVLAAVLYGGAASLAALAIITVRTEEVAAHAAGAAVTTSPGESPFGRSKGEQDV